jgi:hypothetical protein
MKRKRHVYALGQYQNKIQSHNDISLVIGGCEMFKVLVRTTKMKNFFVLVIHGVPPPPPQDARAPAAETPQGGDYEALQLRLEVRWMHS